VFRKEADMKSLYNAYQAYERQVIRGEFYHIPDNTLKRSPRRESFLAQLGDLLIHTGLRLKRIYATDKSLAWSPMIGGKT
jgi:hypothetical protein